MRYGSCSLMRAISGIVSILLGVIMLVVGLRVVFTFLEMQATTMPFASSVYGWSEPFVRPFSGFAPVVEVAGFVLDFPAIIGLLVYSILGGLLIRVLRGGR